MAMAQRAAGINYHQKHAGILALLGGFAMADDHPTGDADQPILVMGDIGQNRAGLGQPLRAPARINRSAVRRQRQRRAHRRPRDGILRGCSLVSSQLRTVLRR